MLALNTLHASDWTIQNPRLTGPRLNAIAGNESRAVAVGLQGHIVTSTDLSNWSPQNVGSNRHLHDLIYANNTFVAVGALNNDSGVHSLAMTSSDGLTWTEQPTDSRAWKSIAYGNGTFVTVGDHTIDTSTDGVVWTRRTPFAYVQFQGIAFGNGLFVTTGVFNDGRGNFYYSVQRSTDGVTWSGSPAPANVTMRGIAFGNGQFVMAGDNGIIFTSANGVDWTLRQSGSASLHDISFVGSRFVAAGNGGAVWQSLDGVTWTQPGSGESQNLFGVGFALGQVIAVGEASAIVASSEDGQWSSLNSSTGHDLRAVTFGPGGFVAVGEHSAGIHSASGSAWKFDPIVNPPHGSEYASFNAVAQGRGAYVAVGGLGGPIFTSSDSVTWTQRYWNLGLDNWHGVAYANGRFVAVGEASSGYAPFAAIFTSTDAVTWSLIRPGTGPGLRCVTYGNGLWLAAGDDLYTSIDAATWTPRTLPTTGTVHAATFGGGRFVLAGELGGVFTSTDGAAWTRQTAFGNAIVRGLASGNNEFVAVGERNGSGVIWSSADGLAWNEDASAPVPLAAVAFGNGAFTAVGANGFVLQSTGTNTRLAIRKVPDGSIEISCPTEIGKQYRLQASSDGRVWTDMANFRAASTASAYRIVDKTTIRLYRLVSP